MKYVVTGGSGFIMSYLIRALFKKYPTAEVYNIDIEKGDDIDNPNYHYIQGDVVTYHTWDRLPRGIDVIINGFDEDLINNYKGTYQALEYAKKNGCKFIQVGCYSEYGESLDEDGSKETDMCNPKSLQAVSKLAAGQLALSYHHSFRIPVILVRLCNVYGEGQGDRLIPHFINNMIRGKPCTIFGTGENIKEWIHVTDAVEGILFAANTSLSGEIFNIGTGVRKDTMELFKLLSKEFPNASQVGVTDSEGAVEQSKIDSDKLIKLGWKHEMEFESGILKTIRWYINEPKTD